MMTDEPILTAMKRSHSILGAALAVLAFPASAQVFGPQPGGGGEPGNTTIIQKQESKPKSNVVGTDIPAFDPSSEMVLFDGKTWNINDNRLLSATFQAYLNEPEQNSEQDKEYYKVMREIKDLLSPLNPDKDRVTKAVALLPKAASYPQDSNISESLLNAIFRVTLAQRDISASEDRIAGMRKEVERLRFRGDMQAQEAPFRNPNVGGPTSATSRTTGGNSRGPRAGGGGANSGAGGSSGIGSNSLTYEGIVQDLLELKLKQKVVETKIEARLVVAKTEYHVFLGQLFLQRRFEHCIIACRFYDLLFGEGESTLRLKEKSDLGKFFGEGLGGNPTTGTLMNFANEAISRVGSSIKAFENHLARNEQASAYKRLQEAFMIGQFLPEVRTMPLEKKRKVQDFERLMFDLSAAAEVKDFTKAQEVINKLKDTDYNTTKAQAYVTSSTKASDMMIANAALLFSEGKTDEAKEEIKKAAEIWPTNPKIEEVMKQAGEDLMTKNKLVKDFDRLVAEKNHREIYNRKEEFAGMVGLTKDNDRKEKLNQILTDIVAIEKAIETSKQLETSAIPGATFAAWEEIQTLVAKYPDDASLRVRAEELSRKASDFVSALQKASEATRTGNTGSSLSWLMKARTIYPDSKRAKEGINRLLDRVLPADEKLFEEPGSLDGPAAPSGRSAAPAKGPVEESLPDAPAKRGGGAPADPFN